MKFPYGISDFYRVRSEGYFYIDRTNLLPVLEETGAQLLFLRPRRFGKSLLLSLLENYYDVAKAGEFDRLFGDLAIGQQPTPLHNRYFIMRWDFSTVDAQGDSEQFRQRLYDHINTRIANFLLDYRTWLGEPLPIDYANALATFDRLLGLIRQTPYKLYLLIDEYDNFANDILMTSGDQGRERYVELVQGEGIYKTLFKNIKAASSGQGLERVFITGVSPIVMADMSSGYNVAKNIYLEPEFNALCGFTEAEVNTVLHQVAEGCEFDAVQATEAMDIMRTFYNGYCFSIDERERLYNPTLVLYFLDAFQKRCRAPDEMLDSNLAMDRTRIVYVSQLRGAEQIVESALAEQPPLTVATLAYRFGVAEMLESEKSRDFLTALLYYLGVLTVLGRNAEGKLVLKIPNLVIRRLYAERLRDLLLPDVRSQDAAQTAAEALYQRGELQPLCDFIEAKILHVLNNRDYKSANELTIKLAFLSLLFEDHFYIIDSEPALDRRYADLLMLIRPEMRQYKLLDILLEFKYLKLSEVDLDGAALRQKALDELRELAPAKRRWPKRARSCKRTAPRSPPAMGRGSVYAHLPLLRSGLNGLFGKKSWRTRPNSYPTYVTPTADIRAVPPHPPPTIHHTRVESRCRRYRNHPPAGSAALALTSAPRHPTRRAPTSRHRHQVGQRHP